MTNTNAAIGPSGRTGNEHTPSDASDHSIDGPVLDAFRSLSRKISIWRCRIGTLREKSETMPVPQGRGRCDWLAAVALCAGLLSAEPALAQQSCTAKDNTYWNSAKACTAPVDAEKYLKHFPEGCYINAARDCINIWECNNIKIIRKIIDNFPSSHTDKFDRNLVDKAEKCLKSLERKNQEIEQRLNQCRNLEKNGRFISERGPNALGCYEDVDEMDRFNSAASKGINRIIEHFLKRTIEAIEKEQPDQVERAIAGLKKTSPEHPELKGLESALEKLRQNLARRDWLSELARKADNLLDQGKPEAALAELAKATKEELSGKMLSALKDKVERLLKEKAELFSRIDALRNAGDFGGARRVLEEAHKMGLDADSYQKIGAEIDETEQLARQTAALSELDAALGRREYAAARSALNRARELGLPEAEYQERLNNINFREAQDIRNLVESCSRHMAERRYAAALACYREVRKRDPSHADAQAKVTDLETVVAWKEAEKKKTVEGYYRFLQVNQDPVFTDFARRRLYKLEPDYWREVVLKKKTKAAYLRYLEIYPKGTFIDLAKPGAARAE